MGSFILTVLTNSRANSKSGYGPSLIYQCAFDPLNANDRLIEMTCDNEVYCFLIGGEMEFCKVTC